MKPIFGNTFFPNKVFLYTSDNEEILKDHFSAGVGILIRMQAQCIKLYYFYGCIASLTTLDGLLSQISYDNILSSII